MEQCMGLKLESGMKLWAKHFFVTVANLMPQPRLAVNYNVWHKRFVDGSRVIADRKLD